MTFKEWEVNFGLNSDDKDIGKSPCLKRPEVIK